jgi:hypothetical protein
VGWFDFGPIPRILDDDVTCTMQLAVPADIVPVMATADFWLAVN